MLNDMILPILSESSRIQLEQLLDALEVRNIFASFLSGIFILEGAILAIFSKI